jgi:HTH-type transcriptional regulator, competence development regulator
MAARGNETSKTATLGEYLARLRAATGLSLREVEEATGRIVSNAYLSQLEKNKINKPSPNILHALAMVYSASYEDLMGHAGYITSEPKRARSTAFSVGNVSPEEQKALLDYLAFLRRDRKKS